MGRVHLNNCWIVEHSGKAIGVIVQDRAKFTFHAAVREVWSLDRQIFPTARAADRAARQAAVQTAGPSPAGAPMRH